MSNERALLWLGVMILIGIGFLVGQAAAVSIAAAVGTILVYERAFGSRAVEADAYADPA